MFEDLGIGEMLTQAKKDMLEELKSIPPVPSALETIIRKQGIKTGSCIFGGIREASDVDILMLLDSADARMELLNDFYFRGRLNSDFLRYVVGQYRDEDSEFISVYVKCRFTKRPVNLLLFDSRRSYEIWADATQIVQKAKQYPRMKQALKEKRNRVLFFETIKTILRRTK